MNGIEGGRCFIPAVKEFKVKMAESWIGAKGGETMNIPFQKHEVEEYEKRRYRGVDQRLVDWRERRILRKIFQRMNCSSPLVLDVPCGYGRFSEILLESGFSPVSCDLSYHMVKRVRERGRSPGWLLGVTSDAKIGLPFKKEVFSVILCLRFFHHVHTKGERMSILEEFSRVSSEWLILSFYRNNLFHRFQRRFRRCIKKSRTRIKMISWMEFQKEIGGAGFSVVEIFPLFRGVHAHHIALLRKS